MDLTGLIQELLQELSSLARADAVVGPARDAGSAQIVTLSKISIGFGAALGDLGGKSELVANQTADAGGQIGGAGGAIVLEPRAFVVVDERGDSQFLALHGGKTCVPRLGVALRPRSELSTVLNPEKPNGGSGAD